MVTSLYSSRSKSLAGVFEALGTSTEFQPGVLVARRLQGVRFGLGAGILIRREALERMGGFPAIADYLADDYMLGSRCAAEGGRLELSAVLAEHRLGSPTIREWTSRQLRWNRGIRVSRPAGYLGLVFTQGTAAAVLLLLATGGSPLGWLVLASIVGIRLSTAWIIGARCLKDPTVERFLWLVPLRDLAGTLLWAAGLVGTRIVWRGQKFRLKKDGRLEAS
jgi:ceramide glucosyltransferase